MNDISLDMRATLSPLLDMLATTYYIKPLVSRPPTSLDLAPPIASPDLYLIWVIDIAGPAEPRKVKGMSR